MFKSIVVAFDGSAYAGRALEVGCGLAERDAAALGIIYVIDKSHLYIPEELRRMGETEKRIEPMSSIRIDFRNAPETMLDTLARIDADSLEAMIQYADFLVAQAAEQARQAGVAKVETTVAQGDPAEEIAAWAADRGADLVVCGSRGLGRWKRLVLGSTSSRLNQLAGCSCLTIR